MCVTWGDPFMYDVHPVMSSTTSRPQFWIIGTWWICRAVETQASCCSGIDTTALHNPNSNLAAHRFLDVLTLEHRNSILGLRGTVLRLVCLCVHQGTLFRIRPLDAWRSTCDVADF